MESNKDIDDKIAASENENVKSLAVCMNSKELARAIEKYDVEVDRPIDMQLVE